MGIPGKFFENPNFFGNLWPKEQKNTAEKTASEIALYYQIASRPFWVQKILKIFRLWQAILVQKLTILPLNPHFLFDWKTAPDIVLDYHIASRSFWERKSTIFFACGSHLVSTSGIWCTKSSKFFACGGHLLCHCHKTLP